MRWASSILVITALAAPAFTADQSPTPATQTLPNQAQDAMRLPCGQGEPGTVGCVPSKKELKDASAAFAKGLKFDREKRTQEAFDEFDTAARLVPLNSNYLTARETLRQWIVFDDLERGNAALLQGHEVEALAEFRGALQLDPKNEFAQQRLNDAIGEWAPKTATAPQVLATAGELHVTPDPANADIHYRGDGPGLLTQVANAFGLSVVFDESVVARPVRFDITNVDFYTAMAAAEDVTHTFWVPLQEKQILVAAASEDNHRKFDRMAMRTLYLPEITTPADMNILVSLLRNLFDIRLIVSNAQASTLTIRAPQDLLDAASKFLEDLDSSRPEVMLDVRVYQIDHTMMRNMGLQIPNQFQLFNIPVAALAALGGQNIQQLINQLIANGGINQANSQAISGLLAQLQGQQNSIFSNPVATFGNGLTLMGLSLGTAGAEISLNESWVKGLDHANLRVSQGSDATFRMGSKYPVLNATFAPIFNSPAIAQVIGNNSFQAPFPSFNYEDLGFTMKAKPAVNGDTSVSLHLELQLRSLTGQSINGVPVITNREYDGDLRLMNGEPAVVAGAITRTEQRSLTGLPGLGFVPGLNQVMTNNSKQEEQDELLVVITPQVIRERALNRATEVWIPR